MIPDGAIFEAFLGHSGRPVNLWDVSHILPKHQSKSFHRRPLESVTRIYVHHSGRTGAKGYAGLRNSARYMVRNRDWAGCGYHFWVPYRDHCDSEGARIVYRAQPNDLRTYHAGSVPNSKGLAIALQGNLTAHDMSPQQADCLPLLVKWLAKDLSINPTPIGHFQAHDGHAKASCPGRAGIAWLRGYHAGRAT